jgi:hypothetical protein
MHATELRNEVKSGGFQTAYLATNKGVYIRGERKVFVLRLVPFSSKKFDNDTDSDVALNYFYVSCRDEINCL